MTLRQKLMIDLYVGRILQLLLRPAVFTLGRILWRDHHIEKCSDITVIKMLGGGSLVIAYPSLLALKKAPQVRTLRLLTTPAAKPFAEVLEIFDEIIVIRDHSAWLCLVDSVAAIWKLFSKDAIVDLEIHSRLTTIFSLLTCARNRIAFYTKDSYWRRQLSNYLLFCNVSKGIYYFYDQIAYLFGGKVESFADAAETFRRGRRPTADAGAPPGTHRIGVAPCCSELSAERMMRPEEWAAILSRKLRASPSGSRVYFLGGKADAAYIEKIVEFLHQREPGTICVNSAGRLPLSGSVDLLAGLDEVMCIDSGLLHFSRLLGLRTTSYWGPTDPSTLLRPSTLAEDEIHSRHLPCSPCVHTALETPCRGNNICMRFGEGRETELENIGWLADEGPVRRGIAVRPGQAGERKP